MIQLKSPGSEELNCNEIAFEQLRESINKNIVFAFIGAGSSRKLGYPLWCELIEILEREISKKNPTEDLEIYKSNNLNNHMDNYWYAEVLKNFLSEDEFYNIIFDKYKPKEINYKSFHQKLINIPFRHYLTTNYDKVLESTSFSLSKSIDSFCWSDTGRLRKFFQFINDINQQDTRHIFHIHGIYDKKESIILTEKDYINFYSRDDLAQKILWSIISSFRMCFIGFSMSDLDLLSIFRKTRWDFGRGSPRHFAIIKEDNLEARRTKRIYFRDKYGIDPIFFSKQNDNQDPFIEEENILGRLLDLETTGSSYQKDVRQISEISQINEI